MKESIATRLDLIDFLERAGEGDRGVQIKYAGILKGLNNGLKNYQGKLEGFDKVGLIEKKRTAEIRFEEWVNRNPQRRKSYASALPEVERFMEEYTAHRRKSTQFDRLVSSVYSSALLSQAYTIHRAVTEGQKPDMERDPKYQDRNRDNIRLGIELAERSYDLDTDRALLKHRIRTILQGPRALIPEAFRPLAEADSETAVPDFVDRLYRDTGLADPARRLALIDRTPEELEATGDPFLELAARLERELKELREREETLNRRLVDIKKPYVAGLLEQKQGRLAPDANSTIRFTYGFFRGYKPRDAVWYDFQTSLSGVVEKNTGEYPFNVPERLLQLHRDNNYGRYEDDRLGDVPACFLNSTSVTGGNSGSPTFNADGEQIGIIFDMTYESVTADYFIIPELQRTISVDIRYVLFITEKFGGATHIINEVTIVK
jgi:hypothetical protein